MEQIKVCLNISDRLEFGFHKQRSGTSGMYFSIIVDDGVDLLIADAGFLVDDGRSVFNADAVGRIASDP